MPSSHDASHPSPEAAPAIPTHRFAALNPFREASDEGGEELGEEITELSVAGAGRGTQRGGDPQGIGNDSAERRGLRVSHALRAFLREVGEIPRDEDVGPKDGGEGGDAQPPHSSAVQAVLARQPAVPPEEVNDRSYPLAAYLIASSHNSYLVRGQLVGKASAQRYTQILSSGVRCVEIDAWDGSDVAEPKVTHGMTLTDHISFRSVVQAIGAQMDAEISAASTSGGLAPLPIFISLENHCTAPGQARLAAILREELGDKLVAQPLHSDGSQVTLRDLEGKILVMVEYYSSDDVAEAAAAGSDVSEAERERDLAKVKIVPELAALGVYAQSIKPTSDAWLSGGSALAASNSNSSAAPPAYPLLNVSEGGILELLPKHEDAIARNNAHSLMRVYPLGTRISSKNMNPVPMWGVGAHVAALNCQTFDCAVQLQEGLFDSTAGYALKPSYLRNPESSPRPSGTTRLTMTVVGGTDLPVPCGRDADEVKPYVTCTLYHPRGHKPEKKKTSHYRPHKISAALHRHESPPPTSPYWHHPEDLTWEYDADELAFVRVLVKSDDTLARNPVFAAASLRVSYVREALRLAGKEGEEGQFLFLRLFNLRGELTRGTLLVKLKVEDV